MWETWLVILPAKPSSIFSQMMREMTAKRRKPTWSGQRSFVGSACRTTSFTSFALKCVERFQA
eukprot:2687422-Pleurochrysis_carterae.AAC.1